MASKLSRRLARACLQRLCGVVGAEISTSQLHAASRIARWRAPPRLQVCQIQSRSIFCIVTDICIAELPFPVMTYRHIVRRASSQPEKGSNMHLYPIQRDVFPGNFAVLWSYSTQPWCDVGLACLTALGVVLRHTEANICISAELVVPDMTSGDQCPVLLPANQKKQMHALMCYTVSRPLEQHWCIMEVFNSASDTISAPRRYVNRTWYCPSPHRGKYSSSTL